MSYENLSDSGRAVAEITELMVRYDVLNVRKRIIPGSSIPAELVQEIQSRYVRLSEDQKAAVVGLRHSFRDKSWDRWRSEHLKKFPNDEHGLALVEEYFGGALTTVSPFIFRHYGPLDRPWQMAHVW